MDTYLVTLAARNGGGGQRILVQDKNPELDWQDWVDAKADTFVPPLNIEDPVVVHAHKLRIKRPLPRTTMTQAIKASA